MLSSFAICRAQTDTLTSHFVDQCDTLFSVGSGPSVWGYISGHHAFIDLAKVQKFDTNYGVPATGDYEIRALLFWFAAKEGTLPNSSSFAGVWEESSNGRPTLSSFIDHEVVLLDVDTSPAGLKHINGNAYYNAICTFTQPIRVPADRKFWAGLELTTASYNAHSYVWLKTTNPGSFTDTTYVMDQWSDGIFRGINTWTNVKSFAFAIFPVIGPYQDPGDTTDMAMKEVLSPAAGSQQVNNSTVDLEYVIENTGNTNLSSGLSYSVRLHKPGGLMSSIPTQLSKNLAPGESDTNTISNALTFNDTTSSYDYCVELIYAQDEDASNDSICSSFSVSEPTGLGVHKAGQLEIFPNPAKDFVSIKGIGHNVEVELLDANGRVLQRIQNTTDTDLRISLEDVESGVYFLKPKGQAINKAYQFIKQ